MKINKNKFDLYVNDNIGQILSFHTKDYKINDTNFDKWINNHKEGPKRELCKLFKKYTKHISYNEFKETIKKTCDDIIKMKDQYKNIIMYIPFNEMKKSNFLVSLIYYYHLQEIITEVITEIKDNNKSDVITDVIIVADDAT